MILHNGYYTGETETIANMGRFVFCYFYEPIGTVKKGAWGFIEKSDFSLLSPPNSENNKNEVNMKDRVNVLGTEYEIRYKDLREESVDGYCDPTSKVITIRSDNANEVQDFEELQKVTLRHEIIHAFLFESGLGFSWQHAAEFGHDETIVDWFARQFSKIHKAFVEVGCL